MTAETSPALGGAIPVLRVVNLRAAINYYVDVLGFHLNWEGGEFFASVSRNKCIIFLSAGDQGHLGSWMWAGVNDAAALEAELRAKGANIRHPATNYPWAFELQVEDLDSNVLRFGSDPIKGQPYGEWLDMNGRLWPPSPTSISG